MHLVSGWSQRVGLMDDAALLSHHQDWKQIKQVNNVPQNYQLKVWTDMSTNNTPTGEAEQGGRGGD